MLGALRQSIVVRVKRPFSCLPPSPPPSPPSSPQLRKRPSSAQFRPAARPAPPPPPPPPSRPHQRGLPPSPAQSGLEPYSASGGSDSEPEPEPEPDSRARLGVAAASAKSNEMGREDLLSPTSVPHPPVQPLGVAPVHGPEKGQHVVVVLGVGPGLGLAIARIFAAQGYTVAIISRSLERLQGLAAELDTLARSARDGGPGAANSASSSTSGQETPLVRAFAADVLSSPSISSALEEVQRAWPDKYIGTAVYNASVRRRGPFLNQKESDIRDGVQASIFGAFTFSQSVLRSMMAHGKGGNLLVTGATSSIRGREGFAGFAASKSGLRAMCQSIAREFGPQNIHVAHIIVDGLIESEAAHQMFGFKKDERFPDGSALRPEEMAKSWLFLAQQGPSAWTHELDLRPAKEHF